MPTIILWFMVAVGIALGSLGFQTPVDHTPKQSVQQNTQDYDMGEIKECLNEMADVKNFNNVVNDWALGKTNDSTLNSALRVQYRSNEEASQRLLTIFNKVKNNNDLKTDLVKIMDSADRYRYQLNAIPLKYNNLMDSELEMLQYMVNFNNKYK